MRVDERGPLGRTTTCSSTATQRPVADVRRYAVAADGAAARRPRECAERIAGAPVKILRCIWPKRVVKIQVSRRSLPPAVAAESNDRCQAE